MGLKCKLKTENGKRVVKNQDGTNNQLFQDLLKVAKDNNEALKMWASSYLPEFQAVTGKTAEQATAEDVLNFLSTPVKERLTPSEVIEVKEFMKRNNIASLSDLGAILTKTFKPDGQFSISVQRAVESGLYSQQEAQELTPAEVLNFVDKIQSHLSKEDFSVEPESNKVYFKDATSKTLLGTYRKASEKEVDETLFRDLASGMSLEEAVNNSPFPQLIDKFNQSKAFREELQSKVAGLKSVPVAYVIGDQLSNEDNSYYTTIKNTIRTDISPAQVDAEIDYIFSIDDDVWRSMQPQIKTILSEIESDLSKVGIDVIGLQDLSGDRIAVLNMLDRVSDVVKNPSDTNISALATLMRDTFGANPTMSLEAVDDTYKGLKIVKVVSDRADSELFENFGLIKISNDGLYHRVKRGNISEMYDMLYNMVKEGQVNINIQSDINNKPAVLAELSAFVNARNTGTDFYSEELSLNQVIFGHKPIYSESKTQTLSRLSEITTDPVYLKTDFVSDFYNYILAEKLKNSEVYRSILSKFSITDRDITLSNTVDSIDGIKFEKELKDYIRLKKDESMNYLLPPTTGVVSEDMLYMNFPQEAQPFTTETSVQGPFVVTKDASAGYKRLDGKLYKKVASSGSRSVYTEVTPNTNPVYFSLDTTVEYDIQNAQRLLDDYNLDGIETQTLPDTTPTLRPSQLQRRNITQLLTNFLSRRGFNISVSTASQMQEELQKRGYVDFQVDAFHGSPYDIESFSTDAMGTGAGRQNYGWGLYFTELEDIAKNYAKSFLYKVSLHKGKTPSDYSWLEWDEKLNDEQAEKILEAIDREGLRDKFDEYSPLIRRALAGDGTSVEEARRIQFGPINDGASAYKKIKKILGSDKDASLFLLRAGIDGVKYKDNLLTLGTLNGESTGFNYVVFDESAITIEDRIQFLKDSDMKVYGFYDKAEDKIYLAEDVLNENTLMHELWHMYKPAVKKAAEVGDDTAKVIIDKMEALANESLPMDFLNKKYDDFIGKNNALDFSGGVDFQIIGEKGAEALDAMEEGTRRLDNLEVARQMEAAGKTPLEIRLATEWEKGADGKWRYEILDGNLIGKPRSYSGILSEVLESEELFNAYPQLQDVKVEIRLNGAGTGGYSSEENTIRVEGGVNDVRSILLHEVQHAIQDIEGFSQGGNQVTIDTDLSIIMINLKDDLNRLEKSFKAIEGNKEQFSEEYYNRKRKEVEELKAEIQRIETIRYDESLSNFDKYKALSGEVEARNVQSRKDMSPEQRSQTLLQETEDVAREDQIVINELFQQGISPKADLTAEAYTPQPGESREAYISRMREEVEANILGKNAEEYFERMAKETGMTEEQTKTFLSKVLDFVRQFSSWLANQLGFKALSPQQASELTTKDMLDRITTTILKDEYGKNVDNLQHILNSNLEYLPLYTEKDNVQDKMNACG